MSEIPESEFKFRFSRSGGPGGQNVNRRDTRVELLFDVASSPSLTERQRARIMERLPTRIDSHGILRVVSSAERSQAANRARAIARFRELVGEALKRDPAPRVKTRPSRAASERRLKEKRARARTKRTRARYESDD